MQPNLPKTILRVLYHNRPLFVGVVGLVLFGLMSWFQPEPSNQQSVNWIRIILFSLSLSLVLVTNFGLMTFLSYKVSSDKLLRSSNPEATAKVMIGSGGTYCRSVGVKIALIEKRLKIPTNKSLFSSVMLVEQVLATFFITLAVIFWSYILGT